MKSRHGTFSELLCFVQPDKLRILFPVLLLLSSCSFTGQSGENLSQLDFKVQNSPKSLMNPEVERQSLALHSFLVGQLAYDEQDFDTALEKFKVASELSQSPSSEIHARLAELFVKQAKLEDALKEVELALQDMPEDGAFLQLYAGILEALGREEQAIPVYERLIKDNPDRVEPQLLYSNLLIRLGRGEDATRRMLEFERLHPHDSAIKYHLGRAYELTEDYAAAEKYYRKAYDLHGMDPRIASDLIRVLLKQQKIEEVRKISEGMLARDPENSLARKILSEMAIGEGRFDEAIGHLRSLETTESDGADARYKIALIQIERQNYDEAEQQLSLVLANDPTNAEARYYLASIYAGKGRKREAVDQLFQVPPNHEMFAKSRTFAGFLLRQLEEFGRAEEAVRSALEVEPGDKKTLSYLILILREAGKFKQARDVIEQALKEDPENDRLLFNYAVILQDLNQSERALEKMKEVIQLNPKHADALNFVAYSLAEDGEGPALVQAEELVQQALTQRPNDGYFLDTLGWIYFRKGNYSEAALHLARAVSLTGDDVIILEHYADALLANDQIVEAFDIYKRAFRFASEAKGDEQLAEAQDRLLNKLKKLVSDHPEYNLQVPH